jgi:2-polyprenyl-3-methyl-5-hydroxy-6-metoxy-1,4-benzoquinol methylase
MTTDYTELDSSLFWNQAFSAADASWRRLPTSERATAIIALLLKQGARTVLDLGCAIGRLSMLMAAQGLEVYGLDASEKAVAFARAWAADEQMPNVHFEQGVASTLTYASGFFDAVIANSVLDHMPFSEAEKAVREIEAVLRPGGVLFVSFDGQNDKSEQSFRSLEDGTRLYVEGRQRGLIWRYYTDDEVRKLFTSFEIQELHTDADGARVVVAASRGTA